MWKALIKLVERLAYRCKHKWVKERECNILDRGDNLPTGYERTYVCIKCMKSKRLEN
jgi:hypothetical protein